LLNLCTGTPRIRSGIVERYIVFKTSGSIKERIQHPNELAPN